jgi:tRNA-specific 2-thiouridylase
MDDKIKKNDSLLEFAKEKNCEKIATGHYANITQDPNGRFLLSAAEDGAKDQTYVLWQLSQDQLSRTLFPLGGLKKTEIREIAAANGFVNAIQKDSQDICFIPDGDYVAFLKAFGGVEPTEGDFTDKDGTVLGRHKGLVCYTKGQRRGLGVSADRPLYVVDKVAESNRIVLGDNADLFSASLIAGRFNWVSIPCPEAPITVTAKTRYSQKTAEAVATPLPDGRVQVTFREGQRAVTPGQSVVLYQEDLVLGGGVIEWAE